MADTSLIINTNEVRLDHGNSPHVVQVKGLPAVSQRPLLRVRVRGQLRSNIQWHPSLPKTPIAERL